MIRARGNAGRITFGQDSDPVSVPDRAEPRLTPIGLRSIATLASKIGCDGVGPTNLAVRCLT